MKQKAVRELPIGLYQVYWKSGGSSWAAVGVTHSGGRWLAPINWIRPGGSGRRTWKMVRRVAPVRYERLLVPREWE